jgi:hypothetical protein
VAGKRVSVSLTSEDVAALEAAGLTPLAAIRLGVGAATAKAWPARGKAAAMCPPHPARRVIKGFCGACGRQVAGERVA